MADDFVQASKIPFFCYKFKMAMLVRILLQRCHYSFLFLNLGEYIQRLRRPNWKFCGKSAQACKHGEPQDPLLDHSPRHSRGIPIQILTKN